MRCKCCDSIIDNPKYNKQLDDWELCTVCLEIVFSVFEDYPEEEREDYRDEIEEALEILDREGVVVEPEFPSDLKEISLSS